MLTYLLLDLHAVPWGKLELKEASAFYNSTSCLDYHSKLPGT